MERSADVDVLIVGAGHAGLGVAAQLKRRGRIALIVDENARVGDVWRRRWPSLRLFTPRFVNALPGVPFPQGADPFPGKEEVADYQETYARALAVPLRLDSRVRRATPRDNGFDVDLGDETVLARNLVVTTGAHYTPHIPPFSSRLDPSIRQLHSSEYGTAGTLPPGPVLVIGGRNSGAEIAADLAAGHEVTLSGGGTSTYAPARWRSPLWWRIAQLRNTLFRGWQPPGPWPWPIKPPTGRWIEVDLERAEREGTLRVAARAIDADGSVVRFADGQDLRPRTVIWATGFRLDDSWIDVPSDAKGMRIGPHRRGPVPGLWANRAKLLGPLRWGALDIVADIGRQGR